MPERAERLRRTLEDLHDEIAGAAPLAPQERELLRGALDEIQQALAEPSASRSLAASRGSLGERLADLARRVEGEHPNVAAAVGRVVDALANLGI
jgi:hypothetical protein